MSDTAVPAIQRRAGLLESAMLKLFTRHVQVLHIEDIGSAFRTITLSGEALRNVAWAPGDKIQIQLGGWVQRTYTPIDWDAENGRTRFLVCLHADGPGTRWARTRRKGDACIVSGPRRSLELSGLKSPAVLFGDETSFGLAAALGDTPLADDAIRVFEVSDVAESRLALEAIGLSEAVLIERIAADGHLAAAVEFPGFSGQALASGFSRRSDAEVQAPGPRKSPIDLRLHHFTEYVVAHGASARCRRELGGRGSLMISSDLIGDDHIKKRESGGKPFMLGQVDPRKGTSTVSTTRPATFY